MLTELDDDVERIVSFITLSFLSALFTSLYRVLIDCREAWTAAINFSSLDDGSEISVCAISVNDAITFCVYLFDYFSSMWSMGFDFSSTTLSVTVSYLDKIGSGVTCTDDDGSEVGEGKLEADNGLTVIGEIAIAVDGEVYINLMCSSTVNTLSFASCSLPSVNGTWLLVDKLCTFTAYCVEVFWLSSACSCFCYSYRLHCMDYFLLCKCSSLVFSFSAVGNFNQLGQDVN